MSWSTPVATSRVKGRVRIGDKTVRLDGWRGSLEHRWGTISRQWHAWDHLGAALVHSRAGSAWMLQGLNRRDLLTGTGAGTHSGWAYSSTSHPPGPPSAVRASSAAAGSSASTARSL